MVRGVDPERWRWLRARSILESYTLSEMISELLYRYRATAQESALIISTPISGVRQLRPSVCNKLG